MATIDLHIRQPKGHRPWATSPQCPGLVYGRDTLDELRADVQGVLEFHFGRPGPYEVVEHHIAEDA